MTDKKITGFEDHDFATECLNVSLALNQAEGYLNSALTFVKVARKSFDEALKKR